MPFGRKKPCYKYCLTGEAVQWTSCVLIFKITKSFVRNYRSSSTMSSIHPYQARRFPPSTLPLRRSSQRSRKETRQTLTRLSKLLQVWSLFHSFQLFQINGSYLAPFCKQLLFNIHNLWMKLHLLVKRSCKKGYYKG